MEPFLRNVVQHIYKKHGDFNDLIFVVPSVRSATFLKKYISECISIPIFTPAIYSIEDFIVQVSKLKRTTNTELLFTLFKVYQNSSVPNKDDFYAFNQWAPTLLSDFDELDRYLVPTDQLFDYLTEIKKIETWSTNGERSQLVSDYIEFTKSIKTLYEQLNKQLTTDQQSYQGLRYRRAYQRISEYLKEQESKTHVFVGFNALNTAEIQIIQAILEHSNASIYWDLDQYFLNDPLHDAGYFINQHIKKWKYFETNTPLGFSANYNAPKEIKITGIPKSVSQAKYIGQLLKDLLPTTAKPIALVLADESQLPVILNSIPSEITEVNITMGYALEQTTTANFFKVLFDFYINQTDAGWYYKDMLQLVSNPICKLYLNQGNVATTEIITTHILKHNYTFITSAQVNELFQTDLNPIFPKSRKNAKSFLEFANQLITSIQPLLTKRNQLIALESLYLLNSVFNQLSSYVAEFAYLHDLKALKSVFSELISLETLSFQGSPLGGLQIMGMLETRTLDFDTVIITSVNEGILPAGKSNNSFIPYDVKQEFHLPTFKDKDAVYTYHFYRLLQRAQHIHLTYNTEPDILEGGEKSRFISQLLTDENINKHVSHNIAAPKITLTPEVAKSVPKTTGLVNELQHYAKSGFSPTSLTTYIRNPYTFYKQYILKIKEVSQVEETIAPNTFGTIIHDTLEVLYTPLIGQKLTANALLALKPKIDSVVHEQFAKTFSDKNILQGQNLIVYKVISKYINDVIAFELKQVKKHEIELIALEQDLHIRLDIPELDFPITLKGKLDRVERIDGRLRIIDYKTGNVSPSDLVLNSYDELSKNDKKSKAFQLLCYALLYQGTAKANNMEAAILSIKNLNAGLLSFGIKEGSPVRKTTLIDATVIDAFQIQLHQLILEVFNPEIPFKDTQE